MCLPSAESARRTECISPPGCVHVSKKRGDSEGFEERNSKRGGEQAVLMGLPWGAHWLLDAAQASAKRPEVGLLSHFEGLPWKAK